MDDILAIHGENSKNHLTEEKQLVILSLDGVSETKSTTTSLDVYSLKFDGCRDVYPLKIIRPLSKHPIDHRKILELVLNPVISHPKLILKNFIADNPKRAFLRNSLQHSGRYSCEYCFESGVTFSSCTPDETLSFLHKIQQHRSQIEEEMKDLDETRDKVHIDSLKKILQNLTEAETLAKKQKKSSHIVWPVTTFDGEPRSKEKILEIVNKIEEGEQLIPSEKKGIKGRSILLDIDYFNYVDSITTEYMHLVSLGVVKSS